MRAPICLVVLWLPFAGGCVSTGGSHPPPLAPPGAWAIAIHGGAGTLERDAPAADLQAYRDAMERALTVGRDRLARGDAALDVCEAVVRQFEADPLFNAGKGAACNENGGHELDAAIMDGSTMACGAVAGVKTVKNPVSLARLVMQRTRHVLLMGDGAEQFATAMGVERVPNEWFTTPARRRMLDEVLQERERKVPGADSGTVGCVALDRQGRLAAATSTGGLTGKQFGRVGDSPIVGAGTYANGYAAVSGTGTGEQFLRHTVARTIAARMEFAGESLATAATAVVMHTLARDDGGVVAVDAGGNAFAVYNSDGMYRALADSRGRFEVAIFER
ncbi:MAG: isoaspartyl peptidase/L-asparaginase [Planctomycetes bacterium]|nr:isoaspartyl peptidase/L-asparaginase [Planctomycetota bacterium]